MNAGGSRVSSEYPLDSRTETKRDPRTRSQDLGIFKVGSSRLKLNRECREYDDLYKKRIDAHRPDSTCPNLKNTSSSNEKEYERTD